MSMKLSLNQLRLLVFVILSLSQVIYCNEPQESVCDDGKQYLEKDLAASIRCEDDESWSVSTYMKPAGQHFCTNETILSGKVCMDAEITYSSSPPLGGHYRPIPPRYGDYRYLPPQRWVHSLVYGALVFLYHPCVSTEDVDDLRNLAKGCLWKHIITPYPHLTRDQPLAIVAHGCVYKMKWVDAEESKKWIIEHALKTDESSVSGDGTYDHDLVTPAAIVSDSLDSNVCLHTHHEHTPTEVPGSVHDTPGEEHNTTSDEHHVNGEVHSTNSEEYNTNSEEPSTSGEEQNTESPFEMTPDHTLINMNKTVLAIILAGEKQRAHIVTGVVVVLLALLVGGIAISIVLHCKYTSRKRQNSQKSYKGFRGFFSSNDPNPAYIPSTGTPKVRGMEKQRLLDSDEEEVM